MKPAQTLQSGRHGDSAVETRLAPVDVQALAAGLQSAHASLALA